MSADIVSAAASTVLSVRDLSVTTASGAAVPILQGVSFDIRAGQTLCIVGESGSGKSVTSLATMGLLPKAELSVTGGAIFLDDENVLDASPARLRRLRASRMSMIFQEPMTALNPLMTVGRQVEEVLCYHTDLQAGERRARVIAALSEVHLPNPEDMALRYPHQLSGGQRQRVMIAMALALNPRLLIADEPTTALDVSTQRQILSLIKELQRKHETAVLFITHDMGVVTDIADNVVVMRKGRVVEHGPVANVIQAPTERYTRKLLGSIPSLVPPMPREIVSERLALEVAGLEKTFFPGGNPVRAVQDVSFKLGTGRILGIVGESGSGKSTVARCVMLLERPTAGSLVVAGSDVAGLSREALRMHRRRIQMVFQDPNRSLNPRRKIAQTMIEGPLNYGAPKAESLRKAAELLELVGLPAEALSRYPHQFSGGQRQRIAIARALMLDPEVIVADEAVSALDVSVQAQVIRLLKDIRERLGVALLFITHDLRVAAQICDDIIVMQRGVVVESNTCRAVLTQPAHTYTRDLIEAAPGRDLDQVSRRWESYVHDID
ncbi:MAG: ABC transporter ATP-binding protein [Pararhodobacter sp.]|nr:ABC transporter ATP-binding protein [Pararhodobacter sp.]